MALQPRGSLIELYSQACRNPNFQSRCKFVGETFERLEIQERSNRCGRAEKDSKKKAGQFAKGQRRIRQFSERHDAGIQPFVSASRWAVMIGLRADGAGMLPPSGARRTRGRVKFLPPRQ